MKLYLLKLYSVNNRRQVLDTIINWVAYACVQTLQVFIQLNFSYVLICSIIHTHYRYFVICLDVSNCPSFLPMVIFKQKVHQWVWIGEFRKVSMNVCIVIWYFFMECINGRIWLHDYTRVFVAGLIYNRMLFCPGTFRDTDTDLVPLFEHWLESKDNVTVSWNFSCWQTACLLRIVFSKGVPSRGGGDTSPPPSHLFLDLL